MTAAGEVLYLPVPSPGRVPFPKFNLERQPTRDQQQTTRHRVYRLPRSDQQRLAYTSYGQPSSIQITGRNIDIYA